jgi:hypothetical protein
MSERPAWQDELSGPWWARRLWGSRAGRIAFSLFLLTACGWIVASGIGDPDGFLDNARTVPAFILAPVLIAMFGWTLAEAVRDLARGENRRPFLTRPRAHPLFTIVFGLYAVIAIAAFLLWH